MITQPPEELPEESGNQEAEVVLDKVEKNGSQVKISLSGSGAVDSLGRSSKIANRPLVDNKVPPIKPSEIDSKPKKGMKAIWWLVLVLVVLAALGIFLYYWLIPGWSISDIITSIGI